MSSSREEKLEGKEQNFPLQQNAIRRQCVSVDDFDFDAVHRTVWHTSFIQGKRTQP